MRKHIENLIDMTPSLEYRQSFLPDNTCQCGEVNLETAFKCEKCGTIIIQE